MSQPLLLARDISTLFAVGLTITAIVFLVFSLQETARLRMKRRCISAVASLATGPFWSLAAIPLCPRRIPGRRDMMQLEQRLPHNLEDFS
jgi:hypothetical protein